MSYETHVTMAIKCITTSIYVYAVVELLAECLAAMIVAAKSVPPTDSFSMLFNIWFGFVIFTLVVALRPLIHALFFSEATSKKLLEPVCSLVICNKDDCSSKYAIFDKTLAAFLFEHNKIAGTQHAATDPKPSEPVHPAPAATAQSTTPPKSPGTPDSLGEERSQADTEPYADAKGEIKPCTD